MVEQRAHIPVGRTIDQPGHDDGDDEVAEGCRDRGQDRHRQQAKRPKGDEGAQVADAAEAMPQPGDGHRAEYLGRRHREDQSGTRLGRPGQGQREEGEGDRCRRLRDTEGPVPDLPAQHVDARSRRTALARR